MRGILAACVFAYHLSLQLGIHDGIAGRGYLAVDGFFLLSGMVLAHAHPRLGVRAPDIARFWARRLLRIYPVHLAIIGLFVGLIVASAAGGLLPRDPDRFSVHELLLNLLLLHGWGFSDRWAWNYPSWSISTEWFGYLAFPAAWWVVRKLPRAACAALVVACLAALFAIERRYGIGLNLTYTGAIGRLVPEFIAGMAAARLASWISLCARICALAGIVGTILLQGTAPDAAVVPFLLIALTGLLAAPRPMLARIPGLIAAGELSYAFYMSFAVVETAQAVLWRHLSETPANRPLAYIAIATLGTLALAIALRALVERPALRLGKRLP